MYADIGRTRMARAPGVPRATCSSAIAKQRIAARFAAEQAGVALTYWVAGADRRSARTGPAARTPASARTAASITAAMSASVRYVNRPEIGIPSTRPQTDIARQRVADGRG